MRLYGYATNRDATERAGSATSLGETPGDTSSPRESDAGEVSFEDFYGQEYHAVLALARVLTGDLSRAEDVTHDSFAAALESWDAIEHPSAWIRTVVANKARSLWRRRYTERRAINEMSHTVRVGMDLPTETESFWAEVRNLPRRQAQAIALFYLEDLSVADISTILGCSESTARVHLTRGRKTLAKRLDMQP